MKKGLEEMKGFLTDIEGLALRKFIARVRKCFGIRVRQFILYGSKVRGDFDDKSDIDILVVLDTVSNSEREKIWGFADDIILNCGVLISPRVINIEEMVAKWRYGVLFYREVEKSSIIL